MVQGSDLKINIHLEGIEPYKLSSSDVDFKCEFYLENGSLTVTISKSQMKKSDDDNYIAMFNSSELKGVGTVLAKVTATIKDTDFPKGTRTAIAKSSTGVIITK